MHTRKRSAAFLSTDELTNGHDPELPQNTPSKRLQNPHGLAIPTANPTIRYDAPRLLNNLAFTRLYVTANFHAYDPGASPLLLCCVEAQNDLYRAIWSIVPAIRCRWPEGCTDAPQSQLLPALYTLRPSLQALAMTAGYLDPNAMAEQSLLRELPLTTTAGLEGSVAEEFEGMRGEVGVGAGDGGVVVVEADGTVNWTSRDIHSLDELARGLAEALAIKASPEQADEAMPDG